MLRSKSTRSRRSIALGILILAGAGMGCKERSEGPKVPETLPAGLEGEPNGNSEDALGQSSDPASVTSVDGSTASPGGALPEKFLTGLTECQKLGRYYDLQIATCTELPLASFPCDLTILLSEQSAVFTSAQKNLLKDYVDKNLQGFALYACTVEESMPALHFFKVEIDKIGAHNVKLGNPPTP